MKSNQTTLPTDIETLQKMVLELQSENQYLLEQFRLAQQKQFGKSSEVSPDQGELFNEAEQLVDEPIESEEQKISYTRNKPKRKPLPKDLPREVIVHDLTEDEKNCDCCGHELHQMGEKKSEQLAFIPAQVKVIVHVRPQYSCRQCEKDSVSTQVKIAPVPLTPIPKSIATPSLLSQIITSKYQFSLPLYRQETMFKQHGIYLNRKTMSEWVIKSSRLFEPIIEH